MKDLQRFGGIAALIDAATYIIGFVFLATLLAPSGYGTDSIDANTVVAFFAGNSLIMYAWNMIIYVINGIFLTILAVALYQRFRDRAPGFSLLSAVFGVIWATLVIGSGMIANVGMAEVIKVYATDPAAAASLWHVLHTIEIGLGGGNEIVGGVWVLFVSAAALQTLRLPKLLSWLGMLIGLAGLSSAVPGLSEIGGAVFGLGFIVWFAWTGLAMLRDPQVATADAAATAS